MTDLLTASGLHVGYGDDPVVRGVDVTIAQGEITVFVGPNGSGKSTLLKALGRHLPPLQGQVSLGGRNIFTLRPREFARSVAFLPQEPTTPEGVTVREVIAYGRYPYTGPFAALRPRDHQAIVKAAETTGVSGLLDVPATDISGGQRQRVWVAMAVAQETPILLLDEPTTYLDPAHQLGILDQVVALKRTGRTIVMVLHDMTHAARFADNVVALDRGRVVAAGPAPEVLTVELVHEVFGVECLSVTDPDTGRVLPVPYR
ncbi:ABC transporter ATP-binding protein [Corynebacterium mayonis]|uniref:ABC transporter ATP-binding protein n=1 Tax=Corynebacterium mayonis TaxID=3062461 RepID=UPI0031409838